jgi:hypothetical protein
MNGLDGTSVKYEVPLQSREKEEYNQLYKYFLKTTRTAAQKSRAAV